MQKLGFDRILARKLYNLLTLSQSVFSLTVRQERGVNAAEIRNRALAAAAAAAGEAETNQPSSTAPAGRGRGRRSIAPQEEESSTVTEEAAAVIVAVTNKGKVKGKGKGKGKKRKRDEDEDEDDDFSPYQKSIPTPGQIAFCFECESRFTVTPYSKASSDGDGLLCSPCGRKTAKQDQAVKKKRTTGKRVKREAARAALDGKAIGAKSLKEMCIQVSPFQS